MDFSFHLFVPGKICEFATNEPRAAGTPPRLKIIGPPPIFRGIKSEPDPLFAFYLLRNGGEKCNR
jgi:hypothetical protein